MVAIRIYQEPDRDAVITLWTRCGLVRAWNDPNRDIDRKLQVDDDLFLVATVDDTVVGSAMFGYEGHRGWVNYLAIDPDWQRQGIARRLMTEGEERLTALGCPKLNLQVRVGNTAAIAAYERMGYRVDEVVGLGKRLIPDSDGDKGVSPR